jgi:hypothetical protein
VPDVALRILSVFSFAGGRAARGEHFARHWAESLEEPRRLAVVTNLGNTRLAPGRIVTGEFAAIERIAGGWCPVYCVTI